jgi:hypothetical protein
VTRWESAGTGPYSLSIELSPVTENYTDLWWNPEESGWGINVTHQGEILFATLFTYGGDGEPDWFAMSRGERQEDGSYLGELYRARGPVFHASPWSPITSSAWARCASRSRRGGRERSPTTSTASRW